MNSTEQDEDFERYIGDETSITIVKRPTGPSKPGNGAHIRVGVIPYVKV